MLLFLEETVSIIAILLDMENKVFKQQWNLKQTKKNIEEKA
jgi:hypothetical protein